MTAVSDFPFDQTLEFPRQGDSREFIWIAIEGQPAVRKKRLVLEARSAGLINDADAGIFLDVAGLSGA